MLKIRLIFVELLEVNLHKLLGACMPNSLLGIKFAHLRLFRRFFISQVQEYNFKEFRNLFFSFENGISFY